jgi:hypothetical protein
MPAISQQQREAEAEEDTTGPRSARPAGSLRFSYDAQPARVQRNVGYSFSLTRDVTLAGALRPCSRPMRYHDSCIASAVPPQRAHTYPCALHSPSPVASKLWRGQPAKRRLFSILSCVSPEAHRQGRGELRLVMLRHTSTPTSSRVANRYTAPHAVMKSIMLLSHTAEAPWGSSPPTQLPHGGVHPQPNSPMGEAEAEIPLEPPAPPAPPASASLRRAPLLAGTLQAARPRGAMPPYRLCGPLHRTPLTKASLARRASRLGKHHHPEGTLAYGPVLMPTNHPGEPPRSGLIVEPRSARC